MPRDRGYGGTRALALAVEAVEAQLVSSSTVTSGLARPQQFAHSGALSCKSKEGILSYRPLYPAYAAQTDRPLGLSAFGDQGLAALIMLGEQFATLGTFGAVMLRRWLRAPAEARDERHPLAV